MFFLDRRYGFFIRPATARFSCTVKRLKVRRALGHSGVGIIIIMYISDRFPFVATKNEALVTRLGEANARRRQYFKYCRDHNDRLSGPHMKEGAARKQGSQAHPAPQPADPGPATRSVVSGQTKPSLLADTEATEFLAQPSDNAGLFEQLDAQSAPSMVSFATSVAEVSEDNFFFPPLPSEAENNSTFLCPYCCTVVEFKKRDRTRQWRFVDRTSRV
jgi:hypothetical protein